MVTVFRLWWSSTHWPWCSCTSLSEPSSWAGWSQECPGSSCRGCGSWVRWRLASWPDTGPPSHSSSPQLGCKTLPSIRRRKRRNVCFNIHSDFFKTLFHYFTSQIIIFSAIITSVKNSCLPVYWIPVEQLWSTITYGVLCSPSQLLTSPVENNHIRYTTINGQCAHLRTRTLSCKVNLTSHLLQFPPHWIHTLTFSWRLVEERLLKRKWILSCSSSGGWDFSTCCWSAATSSVSMLVVLMEGGYVRVKTCVGMCVRCVRCVEVRVCGGKGACRWGCV